MARSKSSFRTINGRREFIHPYTPAEEAALVVRLKARDPVARGQLLADFHPAFVAMAKKHERGGIESDDLVQAINEKLLRETAFDGYTPQPGKHIGHWVMVVAANVIRDEHRQLNRDQQLFVSADTPLGEDENGETIVSLLRSNERDPVDVLVSQRFDHLAMRQVEALPMMQRRVAELLLSGEPLNRIAEVLEISDGSAKTHASRVRDALAPLRQELVS